MLALDLERRWGEKPPQKSKKNRNWKSGISYNLVNAWLIGYPSFCVLWIMAHEILQKSLNSKLWVRALEEKKGSSLQVSTYRGKPIETKIQKRGMLAGKSVSVMKSLKGKKHSIKLMNENDVVLIPAHHWH